MQTTITHAYRTATAAMLARVVADLNARRSQSGLELRSCTIASSSAIALEVLGTPCCSLEVNQCFEIDESHLQAKELCA
jgi:hypothetical protein